MNKILLPTDYSPASLNAMEYASALFDDHTSEFDMLNVYQVSKSGLSALRKRMKETKEFRKTDEAAKNDMREFLNEVIEKHEDDPHVYRGFVTSQSLGDAIGKSVMQLGSDLIVMGTTGASGMKEVFMGSNTVKVVKHVDFCPVLAVPENCTYKPVKQILFVNDFKRNFEPEEIIPLRSMAKMTGAKVILMYINDGNAFDEVQEKNRKELLKLLSGIAVEEQQLPMDTFLTDIIREYSEQGGIQMLAMIKNKHGFLDALLREPVISKVAFKIDIPFLIMPEVV